MTEETAKLIEEAILEAFRAMDNAEDGWDVVSLPSWRKARHGLAFARQMLLAEMKQPCTRYP